MSNFLAEAKGDNLTGAELTTDEVPQSFIRMLNAALKSPLLVVPKPFETWMIDKVASSGFDLPISQIVGFTQFTAQTTARIGSGDETTTSATYGDLTTVGPTLTGLPDGLYLVMFKAGIRAGVSGTAALMSVAVNAAAASDNDAVVQKNTQDSTLTGFFTTVLSNDGNNTLTAKYRTQNAASVAVFSARQMTALKYSNI